MILPNVVIAGAPKCGTTSIFEWLSCHPDVCVSSRKETGFFIDGDSPSAARPALRGSADLEAYGRFFAHCGARPGVKVILEATPDYFDQQSAIDAVSALPSAPTLVFILRRPSLRIYSSFQFSRNNLSSIPQQLSFREFVELAHGTQRDATAAAARQAFDQSRYASHLARWFAAAGRERVCLLLFEELQSDQAGFMRRLSSRIGIDAGFWDDFDFKRINASYRVKSQGLHRLVRRLTAAAPSLVYNDLLKSWYGVLNKGKPAGIAPAEVAVVTAIDEEFRAANDELAALTGIDLSVWQAQRVGSP